MGDELGYEIFASIVIIEATLDCGNHRFGFGCGLSPMLQR